MTYTVDKLRKMRAHAREKILAENPELRTAWEKAKANPPRRITDEQLRKQDWEYLYRYED